ncbi:hypothetical protein DFJ73DRAFT_838480 [Zopfochytrium polystomum]|nr:hypothetical protein DFJ73DRAFT_838480 [Zopfochytrium polystomum]
MPTTDHNSSPSPPPFRPPATKPFLQAGPTLRNQWDDDPVLRSIVRRRLLRPLSSSSSSASASKSASVAVERDLAAFGAKVVLPPITHYADDAARNLPVLEQFDPWGNRIDVIHTSNGWKRLKDVSAEEGLIAIGYDRESYGEYARVYQFAKLYLFAPSSAIFTCPLAMTDGAARLIELAGEQDLKETAYKHLTSRDPAQFWTSGQWMTERPGGSDVGRTESVAQRVPGKENEWSVSGYKWFSSATDADMSLFLARELDDGGKPLQTGSRGLSLFYTKVWSDGRLNGIKVVRLKNKFGTKPLPTAELDLSDLRARRIGQPLRGVATIATILNITRLHSGINVVAGVRRALAIAKDFATKREVFGASLATQPLHLRTLADVELSFRAMTHLVFFVVSLLGIVEHRPKSDPEAQAADAVLRLLTPVTKGWTGKVSVAAAAECMEALGGNGYIEEVGIAAILRDNQVNTIWEGTTNVLALDVLRVVASSKGTAFSTLSKYLLAQLNGVTVSDTLRPTLDGLKRKLANLEQKSVAAARDESRARALLFETGQVVAAFLLVEHAAVTGDKLDELVAVRFAARADRVAGGLAFGVEEAGLGPDARNEGNLASFFSLRTTGNALLMHTLLAF